MKARLENGEIKVYREMPQAFLTVSGFLPIVNGLQSIVGQAIPNALLMSEEDLKTFGFFDVVIPECDWRIQELTDIYFDVDVFKKDVVAKKLPFTIEEYKQQVIDNYDIILFREFFKTDYHYIKQLELGTEIPQEVLDSRAALRTESTAIKSEIMALTTKEDVLTYNLPNYYI